MNSTNLLSAVRYADAVHDVQFSENSTAEELLIAINKLYKKTKDTVLGSYIHEHKLVTSDSYRNRYSMLNEAEKKSHQQQAKVQKSEDTMYRGSSVAVATDEVVPENEEAQYMIYRGQKVKIAKENTNKRAEFTSQNH